MSKPYDASTKYLIETFFRDWLALTPFPEVRNAEVIDSDLSTVSAAADKVLKVFEPEPWILHLELQASRDAQLSRRLSWYNALLEYRHGLPVHTLVILLRREANLPDLTGTLTRQLPGMQPYRTFNYRVLRLWEASVGDLLSAGIGLLPLAPLTDDASTQLPGVLSKIRDRIDGEIADRATQGTLWTATDILMGLRYDQEIIESLMQGVTSMKESVTYQAIVREGMLEGMREGMREGMLEGMLEGMREGMLEGMREGMTEGMRVGAIKELKLLLVRQGSRRFGVPPPVTVHERLEEITDPNQFQTLCDKVQEVKKWEELF